MKCIVPLAGPDFYHPELGAKALSSVDGQPLIARGLRSRPWVQSGALKDSDLTFVLRAGAQLPQLVRFLEETFPGSSHLVLSQTTSGALTSALAGVGLLEGFGEPLVIDLVDILYTCSVDLQSLFARDRDVAGIIPYFKSDLPVYSYLQLDGDRVVRAREKEVISDNASAGTYFFRDAAAFTGAVTRTLELDGTGAAWPRAFFVCPSFNALVEGGRKVVGVQVGDVVPLKWPARAGEDRPS
jgi:hypothetical protein